MLRRLRISQLFSRQFRSSHNKNERDQTDRKNGFNFSCVLDYEKNTVPLTSSSLTKKYLKTVYTSKNKRILIAFQGVIIYLAYKDACQKGEKNDDNNHEKNSYESTGTFDSFKFIKSFLLNYLFYSLFFQVWLFYKIFSAGWEHLMYFVSGRECLYLKFLEEGN